MSFALTRAKLAPVLTCRFVSVCGVRTIMPLSASFQHTGSGFAVQTWTAPELLFRLIAPHKARLF